MLFGRNRLEIIGKTPENLRPELPRTGRFWAGLFNLGSRRYSIKSKKKELANGLKIGLACTEIDGELVVRSFFYESLNIEKNLFMFQYFQVHVHSQRGTKEIHADAEMKRSQVEHARS